VDLDRVAHVFAGPSSRGSAYLIARQLVLTADHVIDTAPGDLAVSPSALAGGRLVPARVAWRNAEHDLALLAPRRAADATPLVLGKLPVLRPHGRGSRFSRCDRGHLLPTRWLRTATARRQRPRARTRAGACRFTRAAAS
jgi:hypothetical protein